MPGRGTPLKCVRIPDDLWQRFQDAATENGTDRSELVRAFVRWYLHEGELPSRPEGETPGR